MLQELQIITFYYYFILMTNQMFSQICKNIFHVNSYNNNNVFMHALINTYLLKEVEFKVAMVP